MSYPQNDGPRKLLAQIREHAKDFQSLRDLWLTRNPEQWARNKAAYRLIGERFLEFSEPLLAQDVFREILATTSTVRLRQLYALALLRSGAEQSAAPVLQQLVAEGYRDEETLGLLARVEKGLAFSSPGASIRKHHLRRACKLYKNSFLKTGGYWTGVNAATLALVLGDSNGATRLALRVRKICERKLARGPLHGSGAFWALATLGEVSLILRDEREAETNYSRALEIGVHRIGDIASMRRNARMVAEANHLSFPVDRVLKVPRVIVFAARNTERSGQHFPSLGKKTLDAFRAGMEEALSKKPAVCFASGASLPEILFLEANLKNGGENCFVLPCPADQFIRETVKPLENNWAARFRRLLKTAADIQVLSKSRSSLEPIQIRFTDLLLLGHACLKAAKLDTRVEGLVVENIRPGSPSTKKQVPAAKRRGHGPEVRIIPLPSAISPRNPISPPESEPKSSLAPRKNSYAPVIRSMLFGDAVGFSRLTEAQVPKFFSRFQTVVAKLMRRSRHRPLVADTWGDGLYLVFRNVEDAGQFSLQLRERIRSMDWSALGLPESMSLRIGLHAGPVYACHDPITGEPTFIGTNVTRAARLEPITPPGEVYTSADFAALAAAENTNSFSCEYVGIIPAAKGYGDYQAYVLKSRGAS
jgi:class 3 adenylate cyclase